MKIKVCGMKNPENIRELSKLSIDYIGFIFYSKSPRYVATLNPLGLSVLSSRIKRVGVFVNENIDSIKAQIEKYKLDLVQLHGDESVEFCEKVKEQIPNIPIIKAFRISNIEDLQKVEDYEWVSNYFLFDTNTSFYGGSGQKFDWNILNSYTSEVPFFLSGGISIDDMKAIKKLSHPQLHAIDINSNFETEPGFKNINLVAQFIKGIKNEQNQKVI